MNEYVKKLRSDGICITDMRLNQEELVNCKDTFDRLIETPENYSVNNPNFTLLRHPLSYDCFAQVAINDKILDIVSTFFEGRGFFLGTSNLRRSKLTPHSETTTTIYHRDANLGKTETRGNFLKLFLYLTDVDDDSGPFTYIQKSHLDYKENPNHAENLYRVPDNIAYAYYNEGDVIRCCSKSGSIIFADTTGLHKGIKVKRRHRDMLTINYCTTKEPNTEKFQVSSSFVDGLSDEKQKLFQYLSRV